MKFLKYVATGLLSLFSITNVANFGATAYDVNDINRINMVVDFGSGTDLDFDLFLNANNQFSSDISGLSAGDAEITVNAYDSDDLALFSGSWSGTISGDGSLTQVSLYLVDQEALENDVANMAPYFTSLLLQPSNIAQDQRIDIVLTANDLNEDDTISYSFTGFSSLPGEFLECADGADTCRSN